MSILQLTSIISFYLIFIFHFSFFFFRKEVIIMCVGLPAKVIRVKDGMALVDASGARREVSAELLDTVDPGDYVMVHAGLAIAKITADDEEESTAVLESLS